MSRRLLLVLAAALGLAPSAAAQQPPQPSVPALDGFRSVLAQGEGHQVNLLDFAAYTATGNPPPTYLSQQRLYVDIMAKGASLKAPDLDRFYKPTKFGSMPGGVGTRYSPREGVTVYRDARFNMAYIYGASRSDVMFGAGYATAEERLFAMDALRNAAKGTLARLTGPSAAEMDRSQLADQNFTDDELRRQFDNLPAKFGPVGAQGRQDVLDYIAGINARIADVRDDPTLMPAEYTALNVRPATWDVSDSVAMAVLLVPQFTVSNGGEERNAQARLEFQRRFGRRWRPVFEDFRKADDPETYTAAFGSGDPAAWKVRATCEQANPPACDQIVPSTLGAVDTPPFPWQNRGTYHQVVELAGRR